jgi:hypothetical protein
MDGAIVPAPSQSDAPPGAPPGNARDGARRAAGMFGTDAGRDQSITPATSPTSLQTLGSQVT